MSRRGLLVAAGTVWGALAVAVGAGYAGFAIDDFFITHRYAWNLAHGHGFVFNLGERVFGTTAPGMGLLLAALSRFSGLAVPLVATATTVAALWLTAELLLAEGADGAEGAAGTARGRVIEALAAGTYLLACPYLWVHTGSETPVVVALLVAAATAGGRRPALAGLAAGAAVWFRPDAGLGVAALGGLLWHERRRLPWGYGVAAGATIAAGLAAARLWFGRFLPQTLEAKRIHVAWLPDLFSDGFRFWATALEQLRQQLTGQALVLLVAVALAGHAVLLRRGGRAARLLAIYSLALLAIYPLLGVSCYSWYLLPTLVASIYGAAAAAGWAARRISAFFGGGAAARLTAAAALAVVLGAPAAELVDRSWRSITGPHVNPRYELYRQVGLWLHRHAAPTESTAYVEIGTIGYFSERPMDDLLGLITPRALPYLRRGDIAGAFLDRPPEYFLYHRPLGLFLDPIRDAPWFAGAYAEAARFEQAGVETPLIAYRRRPGAVLPPPSPPSPPSPPAGAPEAAGAAGAAAAAATTAAIANAASGASPAAMR